MTTLTDTMTEDQLLTTIIQAAQYRGWLVHHVRRSDKALQMGDPGFPDLVLARKSRVLFLELKSTKGNMKPGQIAWSEHLGEGHWIVRPGALDRFLKVLQ